MATALLRMARFAGVACAVVLAACSVTPDKSAKVFKGPLVWPQPPDRPRFAYQTVLRAPSDIAVVELPKEKLLRELTGAPATSTSPVFKKPAA